MEPLPRGEEEFKMRGGRSRVFLISGPSYLFQMPTLQSLTKRQGLIIACSPVLAKGLSRREARYISAAM